MGLLRPTGYRQCDALLVSGQLLEHVARLLDIIGCAALCSPPNGERRRMVRASDEGHGLL
jgi:hypothetical protein